MKEKVIAILTSHDQLRAVATVPGLPSRSEFSAYLHEIFSKAEQYDALAAKVAALETKLGV